MSIVDGFDEKTDKFQIYFLAHSICDEVCIAIAKNAWTESLLPIVVMHHSSQACLYASKHNRHIWKELPKDVRIDDCGVFWS